MTVETLQPLWLPEKKRQRNDKKLFLFCHDFLHTVTDFVIEEITQFDSKNVQKSSGRNNSFQYSTV